MAHVSSVEVVAPVEASASSVSWAAILAGALAAAALSLILFVLGSGLGLTIVSPWSTEGASITTFAVSTAIWLVVMQWVSSGVGGYIAGRLRTRWTGVDTDEVFFRDTAHGFLAWALATVVVVWLLSSALASVFSGGAAAVTSVASGAAMGASAAAADNATDGGLPSTDYFVDTLFRPAQTATTGVADPAPNADDTSAEASRILVASAVSGEVSAPDKAQLARLVSDRTGMSEQEATARVDEVLAQIEAAEVKVKEAADAARHAGILLTLMTFLSFIVGAFVACAAAALGGRQRDAY
jgi:heme/copper-type cytochrome/quinol oxidase subunit 2